MSTIISFKAKSGDPFDEIIKDVQKNNELIKSEIKEVGSSTALKMIEYITSLKLRPQNGEPLDLESHINCDFFEDGWGVGDVDLLNEYAPYWAAINWGSDHMVGKRVSNGYFSPGQPNPDPSAFRQGRWNTGEMGDGGFGNGKSHWSFLVLNAIPAMNYIEKTVFWLDNKLDDLIIPK